MTDGVPPAPRVRVRRAPDRAAYGRDAAYAILDEALMCHAAFVRDGHPVAIPTIHARVGDVLYLHGSPATGFVRDLGDGEPVCLSVSITDGVVLARSGFNHSLNYRSVVVFGRATIAEGDEKLSGLRAIVDHVTPGRWDALRPITEQELRKTSVLRVPIDDVSAKIRTGGPNDAEEDLTYPVWAGVLPLVMEPQPPVPEPDLPSGLTIGDELLERRYG